MQIEVPNFNQAMLYKILCIAKWDFGVLWILASPKPGEI